MANSVAGGGGTGTYDVVGNSDTVTGGTGNNTLNVYGSQDSIVTGSGNDTVNFGGSNDTVTAGTGNAYINMGGTDQTFEANGPSSPPFADTIVGFDQGAGDTIKLTGSDTDAYAMAHTQLQPNGLDTKITLNDGSTILLKWVSSV